MTENHQCKAEPLKERIGKIEEDLSEINISLASILSILTDLKTVLVTLGAKAFDLLKFILTGVFIISLIVMGVKEALGLWGK